MLVHGKQQKGTRTSAESCLHGWKQIAAYFEHDVRTVQRWEAREGLPVHRHQHRRSATVFAYPDELDAWWEAHYQTGGSQSAKRDLRKPSLILGGLALVAVLLWWIPGLMRSDRSSPLALGGGWVLVAEFENHAGESQFDGALKYGLERELANSRHFNLVPAPRISDALRLMRQPPDAPLDAVRAREVCLRDGEIDLLLSGRIVQVDRRYLIGLTVTDPQSGVALASRSETIPVDSEILPAVRRISHWVREILGEPSSWIRESEERLEKVTTPSLRALQLFSEADRLLREEDGQQAAGELLKDAIRDDPGFAAAHTWLAWTLYNQHRPRAEYLPPAEKALDFLDQVSDRERYLIQGTYHLLAGDAEAALPHWRALLERYPEDYWGNNQLLLIYRLLGRRDDELNQALKLVELRPRHYMSHFLAAQTLVSHNGDLAAAARYSSESRRLMGQEETKVFAWPQSWLSFFPAHRAWMEGDLSGALQHTESASRNISSSYDAVYTTAFSLLYGRWQEAKKVALSSSDPELLTMCALFKLDDEVIDSLVRFVDDRRARPASLVALARAGRIGEAEKMFSNFLERVGYGGVLDVLRGELALAKGQKEEAIPLLESGLERFERRRLSMISSLTFESLSSLLLDRGENEKAIRLLEQNQQNREATWMGEHYLWLRDDWLLSQAYRRVGNTSAARQIEERLRQLLAYADSDHPILLEIEEAGQQSKTY